MSGEWTAQIGTVIGAAIGISATVLAERLQWRRDKSDQWRQSRRELYAGFLAGLTEAHGRIRAASYVGPHPDGYDTDTAIQEAFRASRVFELRHQLALIAPRNVARAADEAFYGMTTIRNVLRKGAPLQSAEYDDAVAAYRPKLLGLRDAMRVDLGVEPLHDEELDDGSRASY